MNSESESITVRKGIQKDVPGILECLSTAFEPYRLDYTPDAFQDTVPTLGGCSRRVKDMTVFVAENKSNLIVGTIACSAVDSGKGHLRGMAVIPEYQGGEVANELLFVAETELRNFGCTRVTLDTTEPLERAIAFYLNNGYKSSGIVKDYFGMPLFEYEKMFERKLV